nr:MAG TPA: hypothetical protein [Caudoviricetes sp.]
MLLSVTSIFVSFIRIYLSLRVYFHTQKMNRQLPPQT